MKLLFLEGDMSRKGGTERMTALLSRLLAPEHEIHIVSLNMAGEGVFFPLGDGVRHSVLAPSGIPGKISQIHRLIRAEGADVVINVDTGMGIYGVFAAIGTRTRVITWEHANLCNNWGSRVFPILRKLAAKYSDAMVVLTQKDKENYQENIKGCAPVTVIPNPAERHEFAWDSQSKTILSAGLFNPIKRFDLIPEIGKILFAKHPDWRWVICGDGPEWEKVSEKVAASGLQRNILLPGTASDMAREYRSAAMYVMTSRMEGLPMVLLEAKSWGLPLVSFDIMTGPSDIIRDGVNGFLVADGNVEIMTEQILQLMENEELRRQFSENSRLDMDKFSTESVVAKWEKLIRAL